VAVDNTGHLLTSTNPTGGAGAWNLIGPIGSTGRLYGVSCPTESFCRAVGLSGTVLTGGEGTIATSTNPTGGSGAWSVAHIGTNESLGGALGRIACTSTSFCATGSFGGYQATSTNPSGGAGVWTITSTGSGKAILSVACPSASLCTAGDSEGAVISGSAEPRV
jgi:hypothetical protein